jgi:S-DNA-T family DNA segregation ATPase FtsK/SpoIIIE
VHSYTSKISDAEKVLTEAAKAMDARLYTMGQRGQRVHKPTVDEPYDLVLCDEMLRMRAVLKKAHEGPMGDLLSQGAKASHTFMGLTQVGHADVLGPMRELIPLRFCLRTRTPEQTQTIVGGADLAQLMPAHRIPKSARGQAYALDEDAGDEVTRLRVMRITDEATEFIARGVMPGQDEAATKPKLHIVRASERVA